VVILTFIGMLDSPGNFTDSSGNFAMLLPLVPYIPAAVTVGRKHI